LSMVSPTATQSFGTYSSALRLSAEISGSV
jgi:hypothetical protein